jgi:hypothetical protein
MISNFADIFNGMVVCFSRFKDEFETCMINIIFILHILPKIQTDHHFLKFNISENCNSLNNSQLLFYHISLSMGDFFYIKQSGLKTFILYCNTLLDIGLSLVQSKSSLSLKQS